MTDVRSIYQGDMSLSRQQRLSWLTSVRLPRSNSTLPFFTQLFVFEESTSAERLKVVSNQRGGKVIIVYFLE